MQLAQPIKKILVIRFRRVGDAVLATALCTSLRKTFPDAHIDYVLNANIASLYDNHPDIDRVIAFSDRENNNIFRYLWKVWRIVRDNHYDVIIDMRSTVRTLFFSLFSLRTPFRIGTKKSYSHFIHNYSVDNRRDKTTDVVAHNLLLLKPLEKIAAVQYCSDFKIYVSAAEKLHFRAYMERQGINFSRPVVLAAVTARLTHKIWDKEQMKIILHRMIEHYDAQIVFNFAGNERAYAVNLHAEMNNNPNIFTNIAANSLRELCALTANVNFFFGNEGGPRHLAQSLNVASFAIFPPGTSKTTWLPRRDNQFLGISPADFPVSQKGMSYRQRFDLITAEHVWEQLKPMLDVYLKR